MNLARLQVTQDARSPISQGHFFAVYSERATCGKSIRTPVLTLVFLLSRKKIKISRRKTEKILKTKLFLKYESDHPVHRCH